MVTERTVLNKKTRSFINKLKSKGPSIELCEIPAVSAFRAEFIINLNLLLSVV